MRVQNDLQNEALLKKRQKRLELEELTNDQGEIPIDCVEFL